MLLDHCAGPKLRAGEELEQNGIQIGRIPSGFGSKTPLSMGVSGDTRIGRTRTSAPSLLAKELIRSYRMSGFFLILSKSDMIP